MTDKPLGTEDKIEEILTAVISAYCGRPGPRLSIQEAKAALLKWRDEAVVKELKAVKAKSPWDLGPPRPEYMEYIFKRLAQLKTESEG